ncbi:MAG TPA: Ig-like domain-containing protein [Candidatus Acidoferrales bacterium]|nr:Ig-like domain-containing protein [Candidatus Acidoferrales bacterium]
MLLGACGSTPQIVQISPSRGAHAVRTNQAVRIVFDRPMNEASVVSRFHLSPAGHGKVTWPDDRTLVYNHATLHTQTAYEVVLDGGYSDAKGSVNGLRHSWAFTTEGPPTLTGSSPSSGDGGVDPAAYVSLTFSRHMDLTDLARAVSISPKVDLKLSPDASDPNAIVVIPQALLLPQRAYHLTISTSARDADGNQLAQAGSVGFTTGPIRPLHQWLTFAATPSYAGWSGAILIVNGMGLARPLYRVSATGFSWNPGGSSLLIHTTAGTWVDQALGHAPDSLPFHASWAAGLAPGLGFAYISSGQLQVLTPDGQVIKVASGVSEAAVSHDGRRVDFATHGQRDYEIRGWDAGIRAQYLIQAEPRAVDGLSWAPDDSALAYRLLGTEPHTYQIRVRSLTGSGLVNSLASGEVSKPSWLDPQHVLVSGTVRAADGSVAKAFVLPLAGPPTILSLAGGLPTGSVQVQSPAASPDGHQIAFISLSAYPTERQAYVMNADGTGLRQLSDWDPIDFPYSVAALAWTPS